MSHPVTGNCRIATVCMNGSTPLAAALNVEQPTIAAKVDRLFLERVRAAKLGPEVTMVQFKLYPPNDQELVLVAVVFEGHELRLVLDPHDACIRECFVEHAHGAELRVIVFSELYESCALRITFTSREYSYLTCVLPSRTTSAACFMAAAELSLALGDLQRHPQVHETVVPVSVRSCLVITDQNKPVFDLCASLSERVLH